LPACLGGFRLPDPSGIEQDYSARVNLKVNALTFDDTDAPVTAYEDG